MESGQTQPDETPGDDGRRHVPGGDGRRHVAHMGAAAATMMLMQVMPPGGPPRRSTCTRRMRSQRRAEVVAAMAHRRRRATSPRWTRTRSRCRRAVVVRPHVRVSAARSTLTHVVHDNLYLSWEGTEKKRALHVQIRRSAVPLGADGDLRAVPWCLQPNPRSSHGARSGSAHERRRHGPGCDQVLTVPRGHVRRVVAPAHAHQEHQGGAGHALPPVDGRAAVRRGARVACARALRAGAADRPDRDAPDDPRPLCAARLRALPAHLAVHRRADRLRLVHVHDVRQHAARAARRRARPAARLATTAAPSSASSRRPWYRSGAGARAARRAPRAGGERQHAALESTPRGHVGGGARGGPGSARCRWRRVALRRGRCRAAAPSTTAGASQEGSQVGHGSDGSDGMYEGGGYAESATGSNAGSNTGSGSYACSYAGSNVSYGGAHGQPHGSVPPSPPPSPGLQPGGRRRRAGSKRRRTRTRTRRSRARRRDRARRRSRARRRRSRARRRRTRRMRTTTSTLPACDCGPCRAVGSRRWYGVRAARRALRQPRRRRRWLGPPPSASRL